MHQALAKVTSANPQLDFLIIESSTVSGIFDSSPLAGLIETRRPGRSLRRSEAI